MTKLHMIISLDPVPSGGELTAFCGAVIPNATAVPISEMAETEQAATIMFCKACFGKRYFYAVTSGQEAKDLEGAA